MDQGFTQVISYHYFHLLNYSFIFKLHLVKLMMLIPITFRINFYFIFYLNVRKIGFLNHLKAKNLKGLSLFEIPQEF